WPAPRRLGSRDIAPARSQVARFYPVLELSGGFSGRIVNVVDGGFDMAVRVGRPADSSLIARRICDVRIVIVASQDYIARKGEPKQPDDLARHECIIDGNFREPNRWPLKLADGKGVAASVQGRIRFANADACLRAAEAGLGLACVPSFVAAEALRAGTVRTVLSSFEAEPYSVHALYPHSRHLAAKVRARVDFLVERYRGTPHWERDL